MGFDQDPSCRLEAAEAARLRAGVGLGRNPSRCLELAEAAFGGRIGLGHDFK